MILPTEPPAAQWLPIEPSHLGPVASEAPAPGTTREFTVDLKALPYLADHGFHDMVVLPGAFYVELVRRMHQRLFRRPATHLRRIVFERPVILADATAVTVRVENCGDDRVAYAVFEATSEGLREDPGPQPCARLEIDFDPKSDPGQKPQPNELLAGAALLGDAAKFYGDLRANGNEYGPKFQVVESVWLRGSEGVVGQIAEAARQASGDGALLSPPLLDAVPQLLAAFTLSRGRTFILKSIDHLIVGSESGPGPWRVRAQRSEAGTAIDTGLTGSAQVVDAEGSPLWEMSGVSVAFIDRPAIGSATAADETLLCVAANFTAEPLEDSLRFWGEHFRRPVRVTFAPYNQVFQQLLDPGSAFHGNRTGCNLIALTLEDWLKETQRTLLVPDPQRADACFGQRARTVLPNGLEIVHLNRYETDYVYQEIFGDLSYLRHDIQLADDDTVIDIGANIGLFSLFVMSRCKDPAIYAFEPSPRVFDLLQANCAAYGDPGRVHAFNAGVAEQKGRAQFTFYEHSSVFSSFHPDAHEDRAAIEAVVRNVVENELQGVADVAEEDVQALTTQRLNSESIDCALTSVSDIIRENGLQKINLLKIDAEKSEMGILRGIAEEHWPLIEQIVMEIHDRSRAAVEEIEQQLTQRGFRCAVVEEKLLEDSGLFNIYGTRRPPSAAVPSGADDLRQKIDEFCAALDTFAASHPAPLILAVAPRLATLADAVDHHTIDAAEQQLLARAGRYPQVRAIASQTIVARSEGTPLHDAHSRQLGHVPFTPEGYAAIGTAFSRAIFNIDAPPIKVIALDCDHTLWAGTCGEDGPSGITLPPPFRHLQEFMVRQSEAGVLLALCSKNQEADVWAVFDLRTEMPLRREHFAASRINWDSKPDNLRALAAQLSLGLDSFVFIDDNPVECAAVQAACPEVTVLQLPAESGHIPAFLESLWIFDHATTTREDRERSLWYRNNSAREESRAAAPTLRDFLEGLRLQIEVAEPADEQLPRVAQLTLRTNQFNLTSIRRSEGELREFLASGGRCLTTSVSDRFGDYGLVGAILYTIQSDRYVVDTMLLSCRALGKGVEHRMLSELAQRARVAGKAFVELRYQPTERNEPARAFIERLTPASALPKGSARTLEISSATLAELSYAPEECASQVTVPAKEAGTRKSGRRANLSAAMQKLGDELSSLDSVVRAMAAARSPAPSESSEAEPLSGTNALERALEIIWRKALGRASIGFQENFFDAGGTSLRAVGVVAAIRRELKKNVSIVALFECPTIALLAARLRDDENGSQDAAGATATAAESRGRQRKIKLVKRRTASA